MNTYKGYSYEIKPNSSVYCPALDLYFVSLDVFKMSIDFLVKKYDS